MAEDEFAQGGVQRLAVRTLAGCKHNLRRLALQTVAGGGHVVSRLQYVLHINRPESSRCLLLNAENSAAGLHIDLIYVVYRVEDDHLFALALTIDCNDFVGVRAVHNRDFVGRNQAVCDAVTGQKHDALLVRVEVALAHGLVDHAEGGLECLDQDGEVARRGFYLLLLGDYVLGERDCVCAEGEDGIVEVEVLRQDAGLLDEFDVFVDGLRLFVRGYNI